MYTFAPSNSGEPQLKPAVINPINSTNITNHHAFVFIIAPFVIVFGLGKASKIYQKVGAEASYGCAINMPAAWMAHVQKCSCCSKR